MSAKLCVPDGGAFHCNAGDLSLPSQVNGLGIEPPEGKSVLTRSSVRGIFSVARCAQDATIARAASIAVRSVIRFVRIIDGAPEILVTYLCCGGIRRLRVGCVRSPGPKVTGRHLWWRAARLDATQEA